LIKQRIKQVLSRNLVTAQTPTQKTNWIWKNHLQRRKGELPIYRSKITKQCIGCCKRRAIDLGEGKAAKKANQVSKLCLIVAISRRPPLAEDQFGSQDIGLDSILLLIVFPINKPTTLKKKKKKS